MTSLEVVFKLVIVAHYTPPEMLVIGHRNVFFNAEKQSENQKDSIFDYRLIYKQSMEKVS